jgi:hypothetical protein
MAVRRNSDDLDGQDRGAAAGGWPALFGDTACPDRGLR